MLKQFCGREGIYRDVTQRKNLERELHRLATTDMLTGMANRRAFLEAATQVYEQARADGAPFALLMLDLDHFKPSTTNWATWRVTERWQSLPMWSKPSSGPRMWWPLGGEEFPMLLLPDGARPPSRLRPASCTGLPARL